MDSNIFLVGKITFKRSKGPMIEEAKGDPWYATPYLHGECERVNFPLDTGFLRDDEQKTCNGYVRACYRLLCI